MSRFVAFFIGVVAFLVGAVVLSSCSFTSGNSEIDFSLYPKMGDNNLFGFVDGSGKIVIDPRFEKVELFKCGLAQVSIVDKKSGVERFGFIDKAGDLVVPTKYVEVGSFSEDIAWVIEENCAPRAIDKKGEVLFELKEAEEVFPFSCGLALFTQRSKQSGKLQCGYVDVNGKVAIMPQYATALPFSNGMAAVSNEDGKSGFIDVTGKLVIPYQYDSVEIVNGYRFLDNGAAVVSFNDKCGVIDKEGNYIINPIYNTITPDGELYMVDNEYSFGWIDKDGKVVIQPQFSQAMEFNGTDLAPVAVGNGGFGYIDRDGRIVINTQYDIAASFDEDGIALVTQNQVTQFIDKKGNFLAGTKVKVKPEFYFTPATREYYENQYRAESVTTDYVDIDEITNKVEEIVNKDTFDGMKLGMTLDDIIMKYALTENELSPYAERYELRKFEVNHNCRFTIGMQAKDIYIHVPYEIASSGLALNKDMVIDNFMLVIALSNEYKEKQDKIYKKIAELFPFKDKHGRFGEFELTVDKNSEVIYIIAVKKVVQSAPNAIADGGRNGEASSVNVDGLFIGKIDNKYEIEMMIKAKDGLVTAKYRYIKNDQWIKLTQVNSGSIYNTDLIEVVNDNTTGAFSGELSTVGYSGTWVSADGTRSYPFYVNLKK